MSKKIYLVPVFTIMFFNAIAQTSVPLLPVKGCLEPMLPTQTYAVSQMTGIPFRETGVNADVSGSAFLFEDWKAGTVKLYNGNEYNNVMLKFDAIKGMFLFNRNDSIFEMPDDVAEVILKNQEDVDSEMDFKKIITTEDKRQVEVFVQILLTGKISLYKQYSKRIEGENFTNGIITTQKTAVVHNSYWTILNNETVAVKLNHRSLGELTSDRKEEMQSFIKSKKINPKKETDISSALSYYNTITDTAKK